MQMFEEVFEKEISVKNAGQELTARQQEIQNLLTRDILDGPPQVEVEIPSSGEDLWMGLPTPILEYLEANFLPLRELAIMRMISKSMVRRWWGDDWNAYYDWSLAMSKRVMAEIDAVKEEFALQSVKEREERWEKQEKEDDARDARTDRAVIYYRDHKGEPGVNFKTVARKFRVHQKPLKERYWDWVDAQYESSGDEFFVYKKKGKKGKNNNNNNNNNKY